MYSQSLQAQAWKEVNPPTNIFNNDILSIAIDSANNIYAAGKFVNQRNEYIVAKWDRQHWMELVGAGSNALKANNIIYCLAVDGAGDLYAAGLFTNSTGNTSIAKWDGTTWSEVGGIGNALDPNGAIYAMTIDKNGNLFVAGSITDSSGMNYVAEWNGTKWFKLGVDTNSLHVHGYIYALTTDISGNVYAAGQFTDSNGMRYVAKWNGIDWKQLSQSTPLNANDYITCLATDSSGNVYAGGGFKDSTGEYYIAKWNGKDWSSVGAGANGPFNVMRVTASGTIYVGGFGTDSADNMEMEEWNGHEWNELFSVNNTIRTISLDKTGNLYVAGDFKDSNGYGYIAKWNGISMRKAGFQGKKLNAINGIYKIAVDTWGNIYAIGDFTNASGTYYLAQWNGKTWGPLGDDTAALHIGYTGVMSARMATDLSGNLYVTGNFTDSNGRYYIAKWNGKSWSELGNANNPLKIYEPLSVLTCDKKGDIYAGGAFGDSNGFNYGIMKWNDSSESYYITNISPYSIVVDSAGDIYAGLTQNGKCDVAKINGNGIFPLGAGTNALNSATSITALAIDMKGDILASGLNNAGYSPYNKFVAKWDGKSWSSAGSDSTGPYSEGYVTSMLSDDSGNVYAASATGSNGYFSVVKWNGSSWNEVGKHDYFNSLINSLALDDSDNLYAAGLFGLGYQYVAEYNLKPEKRPLDTPTLSTIADQYCGAGGVQSVDITNFPDTPVISVAVKLDQVNVALQTGASFTFTPRSLSPGLHEIRVSYSTHTDSTSFIKDFKVIEPVTPMVKVTSSALISTGNEPVIITASNIAGGGSNPQFIFSKDRSQDTVLQKESSDNTLSLNVDKLAFGKNMIYVTMLTSGTCYNEQSGIDSIDVERVATLGITDPDYPNQKIFSFPNPFNQMFTINGFQPSKSYTISITNSIGTIIFQRRVNNGNDINIGMIRQAGIYWITVYDNTKNRVLGSMAIVKN